MTGITPPGLRIAAVSLVLLVTSCTAPPGSGDASIAPGPSSPTANGLIAYPLGQEDDFLANRADIYLTSLDGTPTSIIGFEGDGLAQTCPAFSPDGALLAYGERPEHSDSPIGATVVIVALDRNGTLSPRLRVPAGEADGHPCPKWSPDGRAVAFLAEDPAELWFVAVADAPASAELSRVPCEPGTGCPSGFAWAFDSSALVFAHFESLRLVPLDGSEPRILAQAASDGDLEEFFEGITVSPAGQRLAIGGGWMRVTGSTGSQESAFIRVLDMNSAQVILEQNWKGGSTDAPAWSPDGTRVAWTSPVGLLVQALDGTPAVVHETEWAQEGARPSVGMASGVVWSPDGRRLLFVGYTDDPLAYAIVSIAVDGPPDLRVLTPWTMGLYNARAGDLSWQAVDR